MLQFNNRAFISPKRDLPIFTLTQAYQLILSQMIVIIQMISVDTCTK